MSAVVQPLGLTAQQPVGTGTPWPRDALALLLSLALLLLMYRQTAGSMVQIWLRSDTYAHGLLVLPIALWLAWRQRHALLQQRRQPAPRWLLPVALAGLAWLLGELALVQALAQAALVALLVLTVWVLCGPQFARCMAFPLAFLFFAVPVGDFLLPPLMDRTADFTVFALRASGIPVLRAGNSFAIPSGSWSVVEACSGVRYLIASCMLGCLFAYLHYRSPWRRVLLVLASLVVPVLANWVRAYGIVLLGHLSGNQLASGVDHVLYGWLFFGMVMVLMFALGARWAEPPVKAEGTARSDAQALAWWTRPQSLPRAAGALQATPPAAGSSALWASAGGLLLLAALPQLALWTIDRQAPALAATPAALATLATAAHGPKLGPRWTPGTWQLPPLQPAYQHPSRSWQASYVLANQADPVVGLFVAQYLQQSRGHTLVGSGNALLGSADAQWTELARGHAVLDLGGKRLTLRSTHLGAGPMLGAASERGLQVWQLYWVHGHATASDFLAKAYGVAARLGGQRDDAAVVLVYAPDAQAVAAFWRDNFHALDAWLQQQEAP